MKIRNLLTGLAVLALAVPMFAQNRTSFSGLKNAIDFAYGVNAKIAPLVVGVGNTATGAQTITLQFGNVTLTDGTVFMPLDTHVPITVGTGSNAETVTPSAVSCATPQTYNTCQVTATFSNTHGLGEPVSSGTYGLAEAVLLAHKSGGGLVAFDAAWVNAGGATSQFSGKTYDYANVTILDWRGTTSTATPAHSYWSGSSSSPTDNGAPTASAVALY